MNFDALCLIRLFKDYAMKVFLFENCFFVFKELTGCSNCLPTHHLHIQAREAVEARAQMEKKTLQREKELKEENLRLLAQRAREERAGLRIEGSVFWIYQLFRD